MVVDDSAEILEIINHILYSAGYVVFTSESGRKGLVIADRELPGLALVISDITMPDMDGIEFIRKLAQRKHKVPIIVMSGNPIGKQFMQAAVVFGAVDTMAKPFTAEELIEKVRKAIGAIGSSRIPVSPPD